MTRHVNVGVKLGSASGEHVRFHGSGTYDKIVLLKIKSSTGLNGNRSKIEAIAKIGFWFKVKAGLRLNPRANSSIPRI
jgi:hypothetical protein